MKKLTFILLIIASVSTLNAQLYQGPAAGSVPSGAVVTTNSFADNLSGEKLSPYVRRPIRNKIRFTPYDDAMNPVPQTSPAGSNYFNDVYAGNPVDSPDPLIFKNFQGFLDPGTYIPPDPYLAAGPMHIMGTDNSRFRIWNKDGSMVKSINADSWFSSVLGGVGAFDPKVLYDHFAKRWIMVWLDQNDNPARGYFLISVSDDSIPAGTWYNWAIPSNVYGTTNSGSWGDYQGVGFDNQALYITANQFAFGGSFQGTRIRIIPKSELYANTAGQLTWKDLWDLREPSAFARTFGTRPTVMYSTSSEYYLLVQSPYNTGTFVTLYKITNPVTNPVLTAVNVPVTSYNSPSGASQLGGGSPNLETGGSGFVFEPIFRNGFLWAVHSVRNPSFPSYSSVRYLKLNVTSNTAAEDAAMGADGYWHFYPALAVDKDQNVAIAYSRSGNTEYVGAFYTSRLNTDPPNTLSGSRLIQPGKANYVKTFGGGRNRWGDYNGIWLDPTDQNNFWALTEYAETPANTWAAQVSGLRLIPFSGARISLDKDSVNFGVVEVTYASDTVSVSVTSQGQDTLQITGIQMPNAQFVLLTNVTYPVKLGYLQSYNLKFRYLPSSAANIVDSIRLFSNDNLTPQKRIKVIAKGFAINPAIAGTIYGITGGQSNGVFLSINKTTGAGTIIGPSGYSDITGISVRPSDNKIFGVTGSSPASRLVRINASQGDAYPTINMPLPGIRTIAFDVNSDLYCATQSGLLYKYNMSTNDTFYIGSTNISNLYGIAINPLNGQLWGVSLNNKIFKISKTNGTAVQVGIPGFTLTPAIAFNHAGKLYGISGAGVQQGQLIQYDTASGVASLIGSIGYQAVNSITISQQTVGIENISTEIPQAYSLYQNYPNPFNPSTNIKFDLPKSGFVKLAVYDALGREVRVLVSENLKAGTYNYNFNASSFASGVYFYRISAEEFSSVKKMLLIK
jgi:hypothetical protein